jgi:hypothetical protein
LVNTPEDLWLCPSDVQHEYDFDIMDQKHAVKLKLGMGSGQYVFIRIFTDGSTKILEFSDDPTKDETQVKSSPVFEEEETNPLYLNDEMHIHIKEVGISVISPTIGTQNRKELCYVCTSGLEYHAFLTPQWQSYNGRLGGLQIDN